LRLGEDKRGEENSNRGRSRNSRTDWKPSLEADRSILRYKNIIIRTFPCSSDASGQKLAGYWVVSAKARQEGRVLSPSQPLEIGPKELDKAVVQYEQHIVCTKWGHAVPVRMVHVSAIEPVANQKPKQIAAFHFEIILLRTRCDIASEDGGRL
jgi:hypothetical protein